MDFRSEIEVEKQLGMLRQAGHRSVRHQGIQRKVPRIRLHVRRACGREMSERMGYLMADLDHPYITLDNDYVETRLVDPQGSLRGMGLIYEGHKILPYCPRCGTGLASHEVAQGYKMVKVNDPDLPNSRERVRTDEYFLAWTTTPWTLASNVSR